VFPVGSLGGMTDSKQEVGTMCCSSIWLLGLVGVVFACMSGLLSGFNSIQDILNLFGLGSLGGIGL
jgi:hypothetical protein